MDKTPDCQKDRVYIGCSRSCRLLGTLLNLFSALVAWLQNEEEDDEDDDNAYSIVLFIK